MDDLAGLTVISLEQAVAAPYASAKLAQAGARVIKIERPTGDFARGYDAFARGQSAYFVWLNHGKESVCLDLKSKTDKTLLATLIAKADVFIQNLAPGATARLGFGAAALCKSHPRLICCSISGYGEDGPRADQKAYDLLIQAETGLAAITGTPEGAARVGVSVSDIAAGMTAHSAILQALFAREQSGTGREIAVSLFQATADWMNVPYLQHRYGGKTPNRQGLLHPTIAPYGAFLCNDGKVLLISVQNEREWVRLCTTFLKAPDIATKPVFANNSKRVENRPTLDALFAKAFLKRTRKDNTELLKKAGIAYGRLSSLEDLANHPQRTLMTIQTSGGPIEVMAPGAVISGRPVTGGTVPELGADTARIRQEFSSTP